MATSNNLGLYLPVREDYISVKRDLSDNYEVIDAAVGELDVIINGNTASVNVTSGQFVTVINSTITGITDGIYKATANVSAGTAFTSSNLQSVTSGALNDLNSQISTLNGNIATIDLGTCNSISALTTAITSALSARNIGQAFDTKFGNTTAFGEFTWTGTYVGIIQKVSSDRSYARFEYVLANGTKKDISGYIGASGNTWENLSDNKANKIIEVDMGEVTASSYKQVSYPSGYTQANAMCVGFYMISSGSHYYNQYGTVTFTSDKISVTNSFQYNSQFVVLLSKR